MGFEGIKILKELGEYSAKRIHNINEIMKTQFTDLIKKAYSVFNERNIDKALSIMQPNVQWSKAWECE